MYKFTVTIEPHGNETKRVGVVGCMQSCSKVHRKQWFENLKGIHQLKKQEKTI